MSDAKAALRAYEKHLVTALGCSGKSKWHYINKAKGRTRKGKRKG